MKAKQSTASGSPFTQPSFSLGNRLARLAWGIAYALLFRPSPRPLHAWRALLLRLFGARLGRHVHVYPKARIWAPWNLRCGDCCGVADEAVIYNPSPVTLADHVTISQQAYLCGASHDIDHPDFPLVHAPISVERRAWVCARATVQMGVRLGEGAVLGLGAVATRDLEPWTVYGGVPAKPLRKRERTST